MAGGGGGLDDDDSSGAGQVCSPPTVDYRSSFWLYLLFRSCAELCVVAVLVLLPPFVALQRQADWVRSGFLSFFFFFFFFHFFFLSVSPLAKSLISLTRGFLSLPLSLGALFCRL